MDTFNHIIQSKKWQRNGGSLCGPGTDHASGAIIAMENMIQHFGFRSVLDIACGDGSFMTKVLADHLIEYHGIDIVEDLLAAFRVNARKIKTTRKMIMTLQHGDASKVDLPKKQLVVARDVFIHLSLIDAARLLDNIRRAGNEWMLITNFPGASQNFGIATGDWYPMNVNLEPFNMQPIVMFYDGYDGFQKYLALVKL